MPNRDAVFQSEIVNEVRRVGIFYAFSPASRVLVLLKAFRINPAPSQQRGPLDLLYRLFLLIMMLKRGGLGETYNLLNCQ